MRAGPSIGRVLGALVLALVTAAATPAVAGTGTLTLEEAIEKAKAASRQLDEELTEAHAVYREALLDWDLTKADAGALIEQTEGIAQRAKDHGTLPPDEVLELELLVLETKELLVRKRFALDRALADLFYVVGVESHADLPSGSAGDG